ncbi:MAG: heavy metal translocating P-type ATPase [Ruminiclostridium sp.]|nr:heavy metal translocating P-type ATPase [Ruminiclostridium sp.]
MEKLTFDITGMTCAACSARVEKAAKSIDGVTGVSVNLLKNSMTCEVQEKEQSEELIRAIEKAGYGASLKGENKPQKVNMPKENDVVKGMIRRFIASLIFLLPLFYISMGRMLGLPQPAFLTGTENAVAYAFTQLLLCLPVIYINRNYFINGFKALFRGAPNMDTLIATGSAAAFIYGIFAIYRIGYGLGHGDTALVDKYAMDLYFEGSAMILTLITLGKTLEARSKKKTTDAIAQLIDLAPKTATLIRGDERITIPAEEIKVGDILAVKAGESVAADGEIIKGSGSLNESAITGESIPVEKTVGDKVICATVNTGGYFEMQVQKTGEDTTLSQIIRLVEEASATKAPIARLADKISGIFVPVVMTIAVVTFIIWMLCGQNFEFALSRGIAVLVISCPCALGLATPVAVMVGTGTAAKNGILIKSAGALEVAGKIDIVAFDKTGTVTKGEPSVTDIVVYGKSQAELIGISAGLENGSDHPLSRAVMEKAEALRIKPEAAENYEIVIGKGISAEIKNTRYFLGNEKLMQENNIPTDKAEKDIKALSDTGKTVLILSDRETVLGLIAVADTIKESSKEAISRLHSMGIRTLMLTGDNEQTAAAIATAAGIDEIESSLMPEDKSGIISNLMAKGERVAMVGDGINDAPALTTATVGIAVGAGTDIAIDCADIVLMSSELTSVSDAVSLSKRVMRNIKQNLFWAFIYNAIGIPIAAGVLFPIFGIALNPMIAAAAMSLSSFCVVSNSLRLRLWKPKGFYKTKINNETKTAEKGEEKMTTVIKIEGMMCGHCKAMVEKVLNAIDGVSATADLENKQAVVEHPESVSVETLKQVIIDAGYEVL